MASTISVRRLSLLSHGVAIFGVVAASIMLAPGILRGGMRPALMAGATARELVYLAIATELNKRKVPTPTKGSKRHAQTVIRLRRSAFG
jgi:hypothetical protein